MIRQPASVIMLSVVIQLGYNNCVPLYIFCNGCMIYSDWAFKITLHSSSARRDSPCAGSPDRDSGFT